jgi:xanthine/uracil permease
VGRHCIHEWLSIVLILPFVLHMWKNWRPMLLYLKRTPMMIAFVAAVALSLPLSLVDAQDAAGGPPQFAFATQIFESDAASLAAVLDVSPEQLVTQLEAAGFEMSSSDLSRRDIAERFGKNAFALSATLTLSES